MESASWQRPLYGFEISHNQAKMPLKLGFSDGLGGKIKILLTDYVVQDSRIEKNTVTVSIPDSEGNDQQITKTVPGKVIAIRFKKIVKTFEMNGEESYVFEKKKDQDGNPMEQDAEYYTFSGSRIMIDQALNDFTPDDLPCPTVIQQFQGKDGKTYTKFT